MPLVLSLFPGVDLFGRAFEEVGFCVVRGPDLITGGRIEEFCAPAGRFDGVIAGPPCQDFSSARRHAPTGEGVRLLRETLRVIREACPTWWIVENVPRVPDVALDGYGVQRLDLADAECGGRQLRRRHFQFGHRQGWIIRPQRNHVPVTRRRITRIRRQRLLWADADGSVAVTQLDHAATASEARRGNGRDYETLCRLQGLDEPLCLPGFTREGRIAAVGNGVPMALGLAIAQAVTEAGPPGSYDCVCGCGRRVTPPAFQATAACRKRMERRRRGARPVVRL